MSEYLFKVSNKHGADSGNAPQINGDETGKYFGYFQNEYHEQFVFVYDYAVKTGLLWSGDLAWDEPHEVIDGKVDDIDLAVNEAAWLKVCWVTATIGR